MDLPVTLVIKAPNQRIEDHTVDCMLDWTVKKLKQHLTQVYPSQPTEKQQKLIYSGKLLQDHLTLKEVLRQFDDGSTKHTVHLVCSLSPQSDSSKRECETHSRKSSSDSVQSQASSNARLDSEGLRHRNVGTPTSSASFQSVNNTGVFNPYSAYMNQMPFDASQFAGGMPSEAAMFNGLMTNTGMAYSPEQYVWMQQMYAQYMAQYMQYYQQAGYPTPPNTPVTPPPGNAEAQQNPQDVNQQEFDDADADELEFRQQDWLDYIYTFSRCMVLIGIVYFYSSLSRFLMVGGCFLFVYLYQRNWFGGRANPQPRQPQQPGNRENDQANHVRQNNENHHEENVQNDNANTSERSTDSAPTTPEEPQGPGLLQVSWTFIMTFFTSLFPSPPPAVNMN